MFTLHEVKTWITKKPQFLTIFNQLFCTHRWRLTAESSRAGINLATYKCKRCKKVKRRAEIPDGSGRGYEL